MWWRFPFGVCLLVLLGCSSTSAPAPTPGTDAGSSEKDRVLASCTSFAARSCQESAACCTQAYGAYDAEACAREFQTQVCEPAADAVQNGFATYDESAVEPCLAAHAQADSVCVPDWEQVLELRKAIWSACKVVRGTTDVGKGCTISATCAEPDGAKTANCVAGTCSLLEILPDGADCPFQSGDVSTCDTGLYCSATQDQPGVCTAALALGATCSGILGDPSCGFGNYCDSADRTCKKTVNFGGPSCKQGFECVSFDCDRTTAVCASAPAVVTEEQCLGSATGL
ncbi:MAG TPA: hypothetical protein VNW92_01140 [Polyangiaceae bacterium]|nr:hypothetical protein [Polyangiaceae bacterium]